MKYYVVQAFTFLFICKKFCVYNFTYERMQIASARHNGQQAAIDREELSADWNKKAKTKMKNKRDLLSRSHI